MPRSSAPQRHRRSAPTWSWRQHALAGASIFVAAVGTWLVLTQPSNDRDWVGGQDRLPRFTTQGDVVTVTNVRDATYLPDGSVADWGFHPATVHLANLQGADLLISHFGPNRAVAHTFLSFDFGADGRLVVSVEARREAGEDYGLVAGLLRQFEIIYVVGTERDIIGRRTHVDGDQVSLYPLRLTPEQTRALFADVSGRAERLATAPEFYHSLWNNCTTNLTAPLEAATGRSIAWYADVLPGYTDVAAYDAGLLDTSLPMDELERGAILHDEEPLDLPDYSARIRAQRMSGRTSVRMGDGPQEFVRTTTVT